MATKKKIAKTEELDTPAPPAEVEVAEAPPAEMVVAGTSGGRRWGYRIVDESKVAKPYWRPVTPIPEAIDKGLIAKAVLTFRSDAVGIVGGIEVVDLG